MTTAEPTPVRAGPVQLSIPADPTLSRVLRMTASALAAAGPFSVDDLDAVKIAVSEVLIVLVEHGNGSAVDIEFDLDGPEFTVVGHTAVGDVDLGHPDLVLCRTVLEGVATLHSINATPGRLSIRAMLCADGGELV